MKTRGYFKTRDCFLILKVGDSISESKSIKNMSKKDVKTAESILLSQGRSKEAVDMFMLLHRYEEAINVASNRGYSNSEIENMKEECMTLLLNTGQEEEYISY